jgi:glycosyltransferase involved in cell wall biosynthesis
VGHTHLVLIPSYNTGAKLFETVSQARLHWPDVWVVFDGSTDGTPEKMACDCAIDPAIRVFRLPHNQGKGAAVLYGLAQAQAEGFTHVLTMDADGQHNAADIPTMMAISTARPEAMVLGAPIFDTSAPLIRVLGRRAANFLANLQTRWAGIGDSLYGLRVYPIAPLMQEFAATRWMRRFDFDPEAAIRLCWRGVTPINFPTKVRYFGRDEGGVSHFHYLRDNLVLGFMYTRLLGSLLTRKATQIRPQRADAIRQSVHMDVTD